MCRKFNFELQASALEDSIVLSLGPTHSFALDEVQHYLKSASARDVLVQALLDAPMFGTRWRWNATASLAVRRMNGGRKVPPQFQRSDAQDLLTVVFPDQHGVRRRTWSANARFPTTRWWRRRCTTACTRRWTSTASCGCCRASRPAR